MAATTILARVKTRLPGLVVPLGVTLGGLAVTIAASWFVGPSFDEEARIIAVRRATELARLVTSAGPLALVDERARALYRELAPFGVAPAMVSGWLGEVLGKARILDRLVGARLGWLLITGLAPAAVFFLVRRSRGDRVAALAAALLLAAPRWLHGAATARSAVVVASLWLVLLALYVETVARAQRAPQAAPRRRAGLLVAFGLFLGGATAIDPATLWVLLLIVAHAVALRGRAALPDLRRGRLPLPPVFATAVALGPIALLATAPPLWGGGADAVEWLLAPLRPVVEPVLYRGAAVTEGHVPSLYAARWLVATTPAWLVVLALAGGAVVFLEGRDARRGLRLRDPVRLGVLVAMAVLSVLVGELVTPRVFVRFPPRAEAALPFLAVLAALALDRLTTRAIGVELAPRVEVPLALISLGITAAGVPTGGASFSTLVGGTAGALAGKTWSVGDGSELSALARSIDALGSESLPLSAPGVPRGYWALLNQTRRLRTRIEPSGDAAATVLRGERGDARPGVITVARDRAVLWSLARE